METGPWCWNVEKIMMLETENHAINRIPFLVKELGVDLPEGTGGHLRTEPRLEGGYPVKGIRDIPLDQPETAPGIAGGRITPSNP